MEDREGLGREAQVKTVDGKGSWKKILRLKPRLRVIFEFACSAKIDIFKINFFQKVDQNMLFYSYFRPGFTVFHLNISTYFLLIFLFVIYWSQVN